MEVFKFGGASVKDAEGLRNLAEILLKRPVSSGLVVVISAMGKMTNAFEEIVAAYYKQSSDLQDKIQLTKAYHKKIIDELFEDQSLIFRDVEVLYDEIDGFFKNNTSRNYHFIYDQIVSKAELISTKICSRFLNEQGFSNTWTDARDCILTDSNYRRAKVDWKATCNRINAEVDKSEHIVTQGFIARDAKGHTTTLGREGSDYSAGIFAYCLDARSVSVFKDVPGILNADPRRFQQPVLLAHISYREAIEMAFYGASVIHPKTLQPLQQKEIPLFVRSFKASDAKGTAIQKGKPLHPHTPCFIVKDNQILMSISDKEFNFIMEEDISKIFDLFHLYKIKVNLIQNSAISFSVCIEDYFNNFKALYDQLAANYRVLYNKGLSLYTIRHYDEKSVNEITNGKTVLLKQFSRETAQIVVKTT